MTHAARLRIGSSPRLQTLGALLIVLLFTGAASAQSTTNLDDLRRQAQKAEKNGDWLEACRLYDDLIRKDRGNVETREAYHRCYRQYQISVRHSDRVYRDALAHLKPSEALDVYEAVLDKIKTFYADPSKTDLTTLFGHGIQELRYALAQDIFVTEHMASARADALEAFKARLGNWPGHKIGSRSEARELILSLAGSAYQEGLVQSKTAFAVVLSLEFAFGACTGLDEYTLFLTPERYSAVSAALRGKFVGIGVDLALVDGGLEITRIYAGGPAAEALAEGSAYPLHEHDRIVSIDHQPLDRMTRPDEAADRLRGAPGSRVEIEVITPGDDKTVRPYRLARRAVVIPSVETRIETFEGVDIGFIKISYFQETTLKDVQEALAVLHANNIKGIVLDLRGNPGGAFLPAVKIAELFLPDGVIVNTSSQLPDFDKPYKVKHAGTPDMTPMCVLIDSETASSAELVAGALRDHEQRVVKLVGETTFGKGSIQCIIPLKTTPGGIRITVAKFSRPNKKPYTNVGVAPDEPAPPGPLSELRAKQVLIQLIQAQKEMMPPGMMMMRDSGM